MKIVQNRFSELLARKERREKRSISRRQVAHETGLSLSSVQNWATNLVTRYDAEHILVFCQYLDCSPGDLLIIEDSSVEGQEKPPIAAA